MNIGKTLEENLELQPLMPILKGFGGLKVSDCSEEGEKANGPSKIEDLFLNFQMFQMTSTSSSTLSSKASSLF